MFMCVCGRVDRIHATPGAERAGCARGLSPRPVRSVYRLSVVIYASVFVEYKLGRSLMKTVQTPLNLALLGLDGSKHNMNPNENAHTNPIRT
jgi:hypothetical protein